MLKTLLKKQFYELFALLFLGAGSSSSKKKKQNLKKRTTWLTILFSILFISLFFGVCAMSIPLAEALIPNGFSWLYFSLFGITSLIVSIMINAFIANNMIFNAKDNALLLSMPITPKNIYISRMSVLFFNCIIVNAFCWLPATIIHLVSGGFNIMILIVCIYIMILIGMIAVAFASLIGWFIAFISRYKITKIIFSIVGFIILFSIILALRALTNQLFILLIDNINLVASIIQSNFYPLFIFGKAACGEAIPLAIITIFSVVVFFIICFILNKTFISIITTNRGSKKKIYKQTMQKAQKFRKSLANKEWSFLFKTPVYLINCGLGNLFFIILIILVCTQIPMLSQVVPLLKELSASTNEFPFNILSEIITISITAACLFIIGFSTISTPSISVEGKNIWILKSLPIKPYDIFQSKIKIHVIFNAIPSILFILICGISVSLKIDEIILCILCVVTFCYLTGNFGLFVGLKRANLSWTNITMPIKQNLAVMFSLLFGFALTILFVVPFFFIEVNIYVPATIYLAIFTFLFIIATFIFNKYFKSSGTKKFLDL